MNFININSTLESIIYTTILLIILLLTIALLLVICNKSALGDLVLTSFRTDS
ncbi:MAG: hypothetical protein Q8936_15310 [Bacillota bacterium]|nr:hypothetical protein [Bacillota bacterium]